MRGVRTNWTDEMVEKFKRLRAQGECIEACSEELGVAYHVAIKKAQELGISGRINQGRRPGVRAVRENRA